MRSESTQREAQARGTEGSAAQKMALALTSLATLAVQLAALDAGQPAWRACAVAGAWVLALLLARRVLGRRARFQGESVPPAALALLLGLAALPFAQAQVSASGLAPEIVLLLALRNFGLGLSALASSEQARRLSGFVGLCLVTFAVALAPEGAVLGVAAAYAAVGSAWLACSHWSASRWGGPAASTCGASGVPSAPSAPPWGALAAAVAVVVGTFGAALAGSSRETTALLGWVPGSGGTGRWSPESRGGVHDEGDAEVGATKDAKSVGFVDTDVFIESKQASLYDTFADTYGAPKPPRERQRKVVVPFQNFIERHTEPAENNDADEQFSTRRTPPRESAATPRSRQAKALLYVRGRVPLHLRLTAYDRFDGEQWHREQAPNGGKGHDLEREATEALSQKNFRTNSSWLRFSAAQLAPYFGGTEEHQVKIGTLRTDRVLSPGRLERFRIGRIDRPDFFLWAHEDILRFDAPRFPPATTFVTHSRMSDPRRLAAHRFESAASVARRHEDALYLSMPGHLDPLVRHLAQGWARGTARGWAQVEAVVAGLRSTCRHDARAGVPARCDDPVAHFLRARRGPDYLFATSAVLILRSLGYPTRLVSGFYARPERFLASTGHTLVQPSDSHFWAEVLVPRTASHPFDRAWIPVEPTPGYELLPPQLTAWERSLAACAAAVDGARRHTLPLAFTLALAAVAWFNRRRLADALATVAWQVGCLLWPRRSGARHVASALRLLDARGRRAACPRPPGTTPARWLAPLLEPGAASTERAALQRDLQTLLLLADHAAFAPPGAAPAQGRDEARALCRRVVTALGFATLKRELHPALPSPAAARAASRSAAEPLWARLPGLAGRVRAAHEAPPTPSLP